MIGCGVKDTRQEAGFTLLEVLAAMVVFSVAILGLSHANTQSLRGSASIEAKTLAGIVADNQLILARHRDRIETGVKRGVSEQMGRQFEWESEIAETPIDNFLQINMTIRQKDDAAILLTRRAFVKVEDIVQQ